MTQRLIDLHGRCAKLVSQLHLPVQSGSDRILAAMKRGYTALEYKSIVRRLRAARPGPLAHLGLHRRLPRRDRRRLRADDEARRGRRLRRRVQLRLQRASRHAGGRACRRRCRARSAQARLERLQALLEAQYRANSEAMVGTRAARAGHRPRGARSAASSPARTDNNRVVNFAGEASLVGTYVDVLVTARLPALAARRQRARGRPTRLSAKPPQSPNRRRRRLSVSAPVSVLRPRSVRGPHVAVPRLPRLAVLAFAALGAAGCATTPRPAVRLGRRRRRRQPGAGTVADRGRPRRRGPRRHGPRAAAPAAAPATAPRRARRACVRSPTSSRTRKEPTGLFRLWHQGRAHAGSRSQPEQFGKPYFLSST